MKPSVFEFNDPIDFVNATFAESKETNPSYSLRSWAKQLSLPNVAMLSMVLNRKRKLQPSLSSKIADFYISNGKLTAEEARYFNMLVLFNNATTLEEKAFFERILASLRPDKSFSTFQLDQLRFISEWYHVAILEMTYLKDFSSDPQWISWRLGGSVSQSQVNDAIERLLRLGLLRKKENGVLEKTDIRLATPTDVPNPSLQSFHSQMIRHALKAIESQSLEKRDITGYTCVTVKSKIPEAKKMISEFRRTLARYLETPGGETVYQLNIQLFDLLGELK